MSIDLDPELPAIRAKHGPKRFLLQKPQYYYYNRSLPKQARLSFEVPGIQPAVNCQLPVYIEQDYNFISQYVYLNGQE